MKAEAIIEAVVNAGGELAVAGDRIRYRLPKDHPEKQRILDELREHKAEIIRALSEAGTPEADKKSLARPASRPATCAPSCYEVEPSRWIHRPWDGCKTPVPSREPFVPSRADCGCAGTVCSRCWLCAEVHCRCLSKTTCWHCGGVGRCGCTACWRRFAGEVAECVVCHGSGKIVKWVQ